MFLAGFCRGSQCSWQCGSCSSSSSSVAVCGYDASVHQFGCLQDNSVVRERRWQGMRARQRPAVLALLHDGLERERSMASCT
jgi:hypothetical protein